MKKLYAILISLLITATAWADNSYEPLLNSVTLQLSAEQWVNTKSALVTIGVNATVSGSALGKTQNDVLTKLSKLSSSGEWHIVSFNRTLDQSGLERIVMTAQARLPATELAGLRDKAKSISIPGETYTLDNVEFTPSEAELRMANMILRNNIYQQAKAELDLLNKYYPDQRYFLHDINFMEVINQPQPQNAMYMKAASAAAPVGNSNLTVGNKLQVTASVVLSAAPTIDVVKLVHP